MADAPASIESADRVHLVGIGGSGMAAFASLLLQMGKQVSGSDERISPVVQRLAGAGANVYAGHAAEHVGPAQVVVRSAAVPIENPEVHEAERRGLPSMKLAEAVGQVMVGRQGIGVAGTHGKTTTTALVAWLLERAGLEPLALIGGEALNFSGSALLGPGPMVVEADEYDRRFLHLSPEAAIVTSVEADHLDYFSGLAEIAGVFQQFVDKLPPHGYLVVCADDAGASALSAACRRETYGFADGANWQIADYQALRGGGSRFTVRNGGREWTAEWPLVGEHNARNAAGALAVADHLGVGIRSTLAALSSFQGTRRRFETVARAGGVWVVDDYAHHPTAVAATLRAARGTQPEGQLWAVFQPHTTNRTAALFDEFARSFGDADRVLLLPIYRPSGREVQAREVTSDELARAIHARGVRDVHTATSLDDAFTHLTSSVEPGDLVLVMGAGDVTTLAHRFGAWLEARR